MSGSSKKNIRIKGLLIFSTVLCIGILSASEHGVTRLAHAVSGQNQGLLSQLFKPVTIHGVLKEKSSNADLQVEQKILTSFYKNRNFKPYWTNYDGLNQNGSLLVEALQQSWTHGLNPDHYGLPNIEFLQENYGFFNQSELEIQLTKAFVKYAQDLSGMRVKASDVRENADYWNQRITKQDALLHLSHYETFLDVLNKVEPQSASYKALQKKMIDLVKKPEEFDTRALPISLNGIVRPGESHKSIASVRMRLGVTKGDHSENYYDQGLFHAVQAFQQENGLKADGILGPKTVHVLNQTKKHKIYQIIANLERMRWVVPPKTDRFVTVNIASGTLWAMEGGQVALEMPVIIGNPNRPTKSFMTEIRGVRVNPTWTVPPTIKRQDIWPRAIENPSYLSNAAIELYDGYGRNAQTIDPESVDWENLSRSQLHQIRMVQTPGDHNPLGQFRILMDNDYDIYLHDTNQKQLFELEDFAKSSGCVRMKEPRKFAEYVMKNTPHWQKTNIDHILSTQKLRDYTSSEQIPIYLLYQTVWVSDDGQIVFGDDFYEKDSLLVEKLKNIDAFKIPEHNILIASASTF